jgi:PadR family transcriptional regulator PadR
MFLQCRNMSKSDSLGEFEQFVLLALLRLGEGAYGMLVRREIEQRTGREISIGAVYATLDRLEEKGFVESKAADATPERAGRGRRIFELTDSGLKTLQRAQRAMQSLVDGLESELLA